MPDISLLPEEMRGKEPRDPSETRKTVPAPEPVGLRMHVPDSMADEDIEIIEVDESDLGAILAEEPFFTRISYQLSSALDALKEKLFASSQKAPPPKLPPQFFAPPKPGLVSKAPTAGAATGTADKSGATRARVRITPQAQAPRRVRVIRRVRKPVRVSLISEEEALLHRISIPRRQWTLVVCTVLFLSILIGGRILLTVRVAGARTSLADLQMQLDATRKQIGEGESQWSEYRDLQTRLTSLDQLLNGHVITTRLFDFLEQNTLPDVSYQSATFSPSGALSLTVDAGSFSSAAKQLVAFQRSPIVQRAEAFSFTSVLDGETGQPVSVSFQLSVSLDPAWFRGPPTVPVVETAPVPPAPSSP